MNILHDLSLLRFHRLIPCAALMLCLLLTACGTSSPSRFYVLPNALNIAPGASVDVAHSEFQVGFYPVKISPYLDRPQIVSVCGGGEVVVDEFNRWAAPLDQIVLGAVAANLATELPDAYIDLFPWTVTDPFEYKIMVDILRMDGVPGEKVTLIAQWTILSSGEEHPPLARRTSVYESVPADSSYSAYVAGLGDLLQQLTKDIAAFMRENRSAGKASATIEP
ncbi:MAG: PqiC family protein [Kiritimatiellae bacterium]|nr:PqiC family protein [Kiritimatiellia bacterium]MDD4734707.1 PqiC family protein [Kiritimatiellia bacterium]